MRSRHFLVCLLVLAAASRAAADPDPAPPTDPTPRTKTYIQTEEPRLICVPGIPVERCRELPPGRFVDEQTWQDREAELVRAQTAETRLTAENKSMRASLATWQPGWRTVLVTFVTGVAGGAYLWHKLQ